MKSPPADMLKHETVAAIVLFDVMDGDDVRMLQRGDCLGLLHQTASTVAVVLF